MNNLKPNTMCVSIYFDQFFYKKTMGISFDCDIYYEVVYE